MSTKRTIPEQKGYDAGVAYYKPGLKGRRPDNPYVEDHNRFQYEKGWDAATMEYVEARKAERRKAEEERLARDAAERERIANRSPQEILYESNLPDDVRGLLIRLVDKVGLE